VAPELSYCVVCTDQRQPLRYCLDAIARERAAVPFETEVLVLDNASTDGSAEAARAHPATTAVLSVPDRRTRGERHTDLLLRARGRYCLLLSGDSELEPGATAALHAALSADEAAGAAAATLVEPDGTPRPSAWRFPGVPAALLGAVGLHGLLVVQSRGGRVRPIDWSPATALLVRRDAAGAIGGFDPTIDAPVDGADFAKRLAAAGLRELYVPEARAVDHAPADPEPNGDKRSADERYMRKHHSAVAAHVVRWLTALRHGAHALLALRRRGGEAGRDGR
jgi:N-acetylglucosaminyl-diphospho-decaprenol L-rhamnosyltransferase